MSGWNWMPYESVGMRKKKSEKTISKMLKMGHTLNPVRIEGRRIATSFWGKAWCNHLESFSDYANRLPRGRAYVRHGSVINLEIDHGRVQALVEGSCLYNININIQRVDDEKWNSILKKCSGEIASVIELLQGKISSAVIKNITDQHHGLFPRPREIMLKCSCPDRVGMCKHIAAALYGVGSRLDLEPELLFVLRGVDHMELMKSSIITAGVVRSAKSKVIEGQDLSDLFGIDLDSGTEVKENRKPKPELNLKQNISKSKTIISKIRNKVKSKSKANGSRRKQ